MALGTGFSAHGVLASHSGGGALFAGASDGDGLWMYRMDGIAFDDILPRPRLVRGLSRGLGGGRIVAASEGGGEQDELSSLGSVNPAVLLLSAQLVQTGSLPVA